MSTIHRQLVDEFDDAHFRQILDRIWAGRSALMRVNLNPNRADPPVTIVVSEEMERALRAYVPRARRPNLGATSFEMVPEPDGPLRMRMFGLDVVTDATLMPGEIRFRSEIIL